MDFAPDETQVAIRDLARKMFGDLATHDRMNEVAAEGVLFDRALWSQLADAGLLGLGIAEEFGGGGLGPLALHELLMAAGHAAAPIPLWETVVLGAGPIAEFGTTGQRATWLPRVAAGEAVLTAGVDEDAPTGPDSPGVLARRSPDGTWSLTGSKNAVPYVEQADLVLVSARIEGAGTGLFLVDPAGPGITVVTQELTSRRPAGRLEMADAVLASEALLGGERAPQVVPWLRERAWAGLASLSAGICEAVLAMSASYTSEREQFGRPVATFQAVGHRVADAFIDTEAIRLTALQAAWRLNEGLPADEEVAIAAWWAAEAGHRVVHAAHHVHGGVGVDEDYPLYRFLLYSKQLEFSFGSGAQRLLHLGRALAETPA